MTKAKTAAGMMAHFVSRPFLPAGHRPYQFPGGQIYLDLREHPNMLRRAWGWYEEDKRDQLRSYLRPGMVFADVGANKGDYALLAAQLMGDRGTVLAFEPEPANRGWIEKSIALNGYRCVRVVGVALEDHEGTMALFLGEKSGWHSLLGDSGRTFVGSIDVRTTTMDSVFAELDVPPPDIMKIDVEGSELGVLRGARRTLERDSPMVILLDIHPRLGVDVGAVLAELRDHGFTVRSPHAPHRPVTDSAVGKEIVALRHVDPARLITR